MKTSELYSKQISEIYNISPIENIESILEYGLLSYNRAKMIFHKSVANIEIQNVRDNKIITKDGLTLHDFASCYFNPRNAMLYRLVSNGDKCIVFSISLDVLNLTDTLVSDRNASTQISRVYDVADGFAELDFEKIRSRYWVDASGFQELSTKEKMQAEILVKDVILPKYFNKIYVDSIETKMEILNITSKYNIEIEVNRDMFFYK